jgi:hypothetical protein
MSNKHVPGIMKGNVSIDMYRWDTPHAWMREVCPPIKEDMETLLVYITKVMGKDIGNSYAWRDAWHGISKYSSPRDGLELWEKFSPDVEFGKEFYTLLKARREVEHAVYRI